MVISDFARLRFLLGVELANTGDRMSAYIKTDDYASVSSAAASALDNFARKASEYGYEKTEIEHTRQDLSNIQKQAEAGDRAALLNSLRILERDVMPASYKSFATAQQQYEDGIIKWGNGKAEISREAWQMTREEFSKIYPFLGAGAVHRSAVFGAVNQGKLVPPEVLKDYPDLQAEQERRLKGSPTLKESERVIPERLTVRIKNTGALLTWGSWLRELKDYQERGATPPAVEYPPLKCKYCGAMVPKDADPEIWGRYHIKGHKEAARELAEKKLPWSAGLMPATTYHE